MIDSGAFRLWIFGLGMFNLHPLAHSCLKTPCDNMLNSTKAERFPHLVIRRWPTPSDLMRHVVTIITLDL